MSPSVSAPLSSSSTEQKFVKLDSAEGFKLKKSTALEDFERHFFAKFLEEEDDDPPVVEREHTIISNSSAQISDCDYSDNDDGVMFRKCQPCSSTSSAAAALTTTASFTTSSSSSFTTQRMNQSQNIVLIDLMHTLLHNNVITNTQKFQPNKYYD